MWPTADRLKWDHSKFKVVLGGIVLKWILLGDRINKAYIKCLQASSSLVYVLMRSISAVYTFGSITTLYAWCNYVLILYKRHIYSFMYKLSSGTSRSHLAYILQLVLRVIRSIAWFICNLDYCYTFFAKL